MAKFNPDVVPKQNDPSYLGLSRPIEQPKSDTSLGSLIQGIGNVFEGTVKAADGLVKASISQDVYKAVDAVRDEQTTALEGLHVGKARKGVFADAAAPGDVEDPMDAYGQANPRDIPSDSNSALNLLPESPDAPPPAGVAEVGQRVGSLQNALESGKISNAYYMSRLNTISKEMRARYPGYREYIDKEISQVTGVNPANAYISAMMSDINARQTQAGNNTNRALRLLEKHAGEADAPAMMDAFQRGQIDYSDVFTWGAKHDFTKAKLEKEKNERANRKETNADTDADDERKATQLTRGIMTNYYDSIKVIGGTRTVGEVQELIRKHNNGDKLTQTAITELGMAMSSARPVIFAEMRRKMTAQNYGFSGTKMNEIIKNEMELFDEVHKSITEKRLVATDSYQNMIKAKTEDTTEAMMLHNKDLASFVTMMRVGQLMGPQAAEKILQSSVLNIGAVDAPIKGFMDWHKLGALTQPNINQGGRPNSLAATVQEAVQHNIKKPEVFKEFVGMINTFSEPNSMTDEGKTNIAQFFYGPDNAQVLDKFQKEYRDANGRMVPGRMSVFARLTDAPVVKEVKRLGPETWQNFTSWADNQFGNILLRDAIQDLNQFSNAPGVKVKWNSETHQWGIDFAPSLGALYSARNPRPQGMTIAQQQVARDAINNINIGLTRQANIAKESGVDPNAYVLGKLMDFGFNPRMGAEGIPDKQRFGYDNKTSILQQLGGAIVSSQKAPQSPQDARTRVKTDEPRVDIPHFAPKDKEAPQTIEQWQNMLRDPPIPTREEVKSTKRWYGDKEAEEAGLYEPAPKKKK